MVAMAEDPGDRPMNALMTIGVPTAVRIVPVSVRNLLDQMAKNLTTACASLATALREVLDDRFWECSPPGRPLPRPNVKLTRHQPSIATMRASGDAVEAQRRLGVPPHDPTRHRAPNWTCKTTQQVPLPLRPPTWRGRAFEE